MGCCSRDPHSRQAPKDRERRSTYFNKLKLSPEPTGKTLVAMQTVRTASAQGHGGCETARGCLHGDRTRIESKGLSPGLGPGWGTGSPGGKAETPTA